MTGPVKPWVWSGHRQPKLLCEALRFTGTQAWPAWLCDPISPQRSPLDASVGNLVAEETVELGFRFVMIVTIEFV